MIMIKAACARPVSALALVAAILASPLGWIHYTLFLLPVILGHWHRLGMRVVDEEQKELALHRPTLSMLATRSVHYVFFNWQNMALFFAAPLLLLLLSRERPRLSRLVIIIAAIAFALARHTPRQGSLSSGPMRHFVSRIKSLRNWCRTACARCLPLLRILLAGK